MIVDMLFFTGLDQIEFPRTSRNGEKFLDRYYLTNDREKIDKLIGRVATNIGSVEYRYLRERCSALIYSNDRVEIKEPSNLSMQIESRTIEALALVQSFLEKLWIVKDNAAVQDRGWLVTNMAAETHIHTNTWNVRHTTANGKFDVIRFSLEELRCSRKFLFSADVEYLNGSERPTSLISTSLRFQRFMYFVQMARTSSDVAMKIAQYCSALEALVSSSSSELTHQVAERAACLLEPPGEARLDRFKKLKEAYGYRSCAVHGASFKDKVFDRLRSTSCYIDDVCRQLALLYLANPEKIARSIEGNEEDFNAFFYRLTFCV